MWCQLKALMLQELLSWLDACSDFFGWKKNRRRRTTSRQQQSNESKLMLGGFVWYTLKRDHNNKKIYKYVLNVEKSANSGYCGNFECSGYYYSGVHRYCEVEYSFYKFMVILYFRFSHFQEFHFQKYYFQNSCTVFFYFQCTVI